MPKFRYDGEEPRVYAEQPYALGEVHPGDEHDLADAPDHRWSKASSTASKPAKAAKKAAAPRRKAKEAAEAPPAPSGLPGDQPLAQPTPDPSDA